MSRRPARPTARWCCCCTASRSSGGPGAHQLPALAAAGYRAVAMDLRGYGGSDKTPNGYDPLTLAQDVSGVVKALGGRSAVLVGHGWGGYVAWATAVLHAREVSALVRRGGTAPAGDAAAPCGRGGRSRRCGTCWRCRCRCSPSAGWPTRPAASCASTCGRGAPPARPSPTSTPSRRTSGRSGCGRPRTARWSTTAGCSAPGCAPTAGASGALMRPAGRRSRCCCVTGADDPALPPGRWRARARTSSAS